MNNYLYECDPKLNTKCCNKYGCQQWCFHTRHKEFAKTDKAYEVDQELNMVEVEEEKPKPKPKKKTTAKKK